MSYILDALRRADAERELGQVPSLHAQAAVPPGFDDGFDSSSYRSWLWVVLIAVLMAAGGAAWLFLGDGASEVKPALNVTTPTPMAQAVAEAPLPPPPLVPVDPAVAPATVAMLASAPVPPPSAKEVPVPPVPEPLQKKAAAHVTASAGTPKKMPALETPTAASRTPVKAVAEAKQDAIVTLNDLPEAIRREQPKLTIGGAMHSATAANRMLILNGQVFHEGDQITADLVLEQIKLKSAVLVYKGYRYSINY